MGCNLKKTDTVYFIKVKFIGFLKTVSVLSVSEQDQPFR